MKMFSVEIRWYQNALINVLVAGNQDDAVEAACKIMETYPVVPDGLYDSGEDNWAVGQIRTSDVDVAG